ncbi:MAG: hypothetical protein R3D25_02020 [Geminicoccaceae bacterium]
MRRSYGGGGDVGLFLDGDQLVLQLQDATSSHVLTSAGGAVTAGEAHHVAFTFGAAGRRALARRGRGGALGLCRQARAMAKPLVRGARLDQRAAPPTRSPTRSTAGSTR